MKVRCKCQRTENSLLLCASFTKTSKNFGNWTGRGKRYLWNCWPKKLKRQEPEAEKMRQKSKGSILANIIWKSLGLTWEYAKQCFRIYCRLQNGWHSNGKMKKMKKICRRMMRILTWMRRKWSPSVRNSERQFKLKHWMSFYVVDLIWSLTGNSNESFSCFIKMMFRKMLIRFLNVNLMNFLKTST